MKHGDDFGESPTGTFTLANDEQIVVVEGRSGDGIDRLLFTTSKGNRYGPYGGMGGAPFRLEGPVYGFFGGNSGLGARSALTCLGTWTEPSPPPPAPLPPPSLPVPGMRSPTFGSQSNLSSTWDDGAAFTGYAFPPDYVEQLNRNTYDHLVVDFRLSS